MMYSYVCHVHIYHYETKLESCTFIREKSVCYDSFVSGLKTVPHIVLETCVRNGILNLTQIWHQIFITFKKRFVYEKHFCKAEILLQLKTPVGLYIISIYQLQAL